VTTIATRLGPSS